MATEDEEFEFRLRAERETAARVPTPARQPAPDIPGTPAGYADRVAQIPTDQYPAAPQAQRPAPVPQEERGLFSRIRAGVEAARSTIASIVPGGVGFGLGAAEGMLRNIASGKFGTQEGTGLVEQTAAKRAQQFTEATVAKPPSALGQEYAQDVGEFMQRHGASVLAGPLGVTGAGRHTENLRNARQGLKASTATAEVPPGLPSVAGEAPGAVKPTGGLAKRAVQPNPALLETVGSAEKAGLTVLPHHVAEGEAVRALGTAAGGDVYKQNTKAFTKALIKELDPDETAPRLDTKTFHRVLDKQGKTIGENMAKYDMQVDDALRARLEAISKDAADNADADTGRMTMNRVREILGKAEAGEGSIAGQAVRELDTAIGRQIRSNTKNQDLVARLRAVQDVLRDTAEGQMKPDEAKAVQQARRRYAYAMEILPDIDDFGRTGYYEPGQLWKRLTSSEAGRQRVANERGGLTDLAKAGALVADRSGTGHGYVSVGNSGVGVGASGMRAYASPNMMLKLVTGGAIGEKAYNRFGPNLVKRLAAEHDAELARAAQAPEPPPLELAPEGAPTPQGPRPDVRGEAPAEVPEWSTAAGAGVERPGSQIPAIEPEGLLPAVGDDMPPARINPEPRGRVPDIPAVPGRPDMPDVMVVGGPREVAATEATGRAMQSEGATLAREQQGFAPPKAPPETPPPAGGPGNGGSTPPGGGMDPRLAKIAELRRRSTSPAVTKVLDAQEAALKKAIKRETDIAELEAAAQATDDVDLRQSLLAEANKLRGGKLSVGEVKDGQPALPKGKTEKIPVGQVIEGQPELPAATAERIPVGEATEITPEVVEAAPERMPVGEATEMPEPLPVGEVTENPIPVGEAMEFEPLPVGEAAEIAPETVEPARGPVVPEATNVDNAPAAPAGGGRSEGMEQTKAPPKPEDFANGAEYHLAVREWRSKHGAKTPEPSARTKAVVDLDRKIKNAERRLAERRNGRTGLTPPAITAEAIANIEKELLVLREQRAAAAQQENTRAPQEVAQQAGVPAEPQGRTGGREAAEAGAGDRVQRAAESGGQAEGAKKEAVKSAALSDSRKATKGALERAGYVVQDLDIGTKLQSRGDLRVSLKAIPRDIDVVISLKNGKWKFSDVSSEAPSSISQAEAVTEFRKLIDGSSVAARPAAEPTKPTAAAAPKPAPSTEAPAPKPTGKALAPAEVKAELVRQLDEAHAKALPDDAPEVLALESAQKARVNEKALEREYRLPSDRERARAAAQAEINDRRLEAAKAVGYVTIRAGGSAMQVLNTAKRIAEVRKKLAGATGKTSRPEARDWDYGDSKRAPITTIKDMIDDLDPQAAVDFAAAQGINLEEALKGDRKRLDQVRNLKPTPEPQEVANEPPTAGSNFLEDLYGEQAKASKAKVRGGPAVSAAMSAARGLWSSAAQNKQTAAFSRALRAAGVPDKKIVAAISEAKTAHANRTRGSGSITFLSGNDLREGLLRAGIDL